MTTQSSWCAAVSVLLTTVSLAGCMTPGDTSDLVTLQQQLRILQDQQAATEARLRQLQGQAERAEAQAEAALTKANQASLTAQSMSEAIDDRIDQLFQRTMFK